MRSWSFYSVNSKVVQVRRESSDRPGVHGTFTYALNGNELIERHSTSRLYVAKEYIKAKIDVDDVPPSRFRRSSHPCELKRTRKWNRCLERYFTEIHCRKAYIACLPYNAPPKCKKNHEIMFGKNGRACHVVKSCICV